MIKMVRLNDNNSNKNKQKLICNHKKNKKFKIASKNKKIH